jgi:Uma2 family endonuclease
VASDATERPVGLPADLPETDGAPLESEWHRKAINLLSEILWFWLRDLPNWYCGGNMFIYFSAEQVRNRDYRGPDFFFVKGMERDRERRYWAVWEEGHRFPNVIIELASPTTLREDRTTQKRIYERIFHTPDYFIYNPDTQELEGWRLGPAGRYRKLRPNRQGRGNGGRRG